MALLKPMASNVTFKDAIESHEETSISNTKHEYKVELVWQNIIIFIVIHVASLYALYLAFTSAKLRTLLTSFFLFRWFALGVTAAAHKHFAHRSFKARLPLRLYLVTDHHVPVYFCDETWTNAFFLSGILRYTVSLHVTFLVNSAAHKYGNRPYDKNIGASDQFITGIITAGEGWHNFHHAFPWGYRCSEFGGYLFNTTQFYIDLFENLGLAYDLKIASPKLIQSLVNKRGDGSHVLFEALPPKDSSDYS